MFSYISASRNRLVIISHSQSGIWTGGESLNLNLKRAKLLYSLHLRPSNFDFEFSRHISGILDTITDAPRKNCEVFNIVEKPLTPPPPFFVWTSCCKFLCWGGGWVGYQTRSAYQPLLTHPCPYGMFLDPEITSKKTIAAHNKSFGIKQKLQHNFLHRFALPPP